MTKRKIITGSLILLSIILALIFAVSGAAFDLVKMFSSSPLLAAFIVGIGFSSLFTAAPAVVALGAISSFTGLWPMAVFGGAGALVGDLILLKVMKVAATSARKPVGNVLKAPRFLKLHRLREILSHGPFKVVLWVTGAFIIASPFPDELGLAIMGASRIPMWLLMCLSFTLNTIGIFAIGVVANSI